MFFFYFDEECKKRLRSRSREEAAGGKQRDKERSKDETFYQKCIAFLIY